MLSKNTRTHIVVLSDSREIRITQEQYSSIYLFCQDSKINEFIEIKDVDTGYVLFSGRSGMIKEFREIKNANISGVSYVCLFGTRHPVNEDCKCGKSVNFISQEDLVKKIEWTNKKMEEIGEEGMEYFLDLARFNLKTAIAKGNIGPKFIKEYANYLMRKEYNCPYK